MGTPLASAASKASVEDQDDAISDLSREELERYPAGVITLARDGTVLHYNRAESAFSRLKPHQVIGRRFFGDVAPCAAVRNFQGRFDGFAAADGDATDRFDFAFDFAWGRHDVTITMLRRSGREEIHLVVRARSTRRRSSAPRAAEHAPPGGVERRGGPPEPLFGQWVEEADGSAWWSPEIRRIFGLGDESTAAASALQAAIAPGDAPRVAEAHRAAGEGRPVTVRYSIATPGGVRALLEHVVAFRTGAGMRRYGTILDVTDREGEERRLWRSAHHDALTGLPNRQLLFERLRSALADDVPVALLFLDLDRFKQVNDSAGHAVGDALLRLAASRLTGCVSAGDTVARLNGDEFVLLLRNVRESGQAEAVAEAVLDAIARPFVIDQEQHFVTVSVGIARSPHDANDADGLLRAADLAMYHSKQHGANGLRTYDAGLARLAGEEILREHALRRAVDRDEFVVFFQPIVDALSGRIVKAEALVRWQDPERGLVPPAEFIPLAERTGLIAPLGAAVLDRACAQIAAWREAGLPPIVVAVNISPLQFKDRRFPQIAGETIERHAIDPALLELELTESLAERFDETMESLLDLKLLGVRLAIDDFGTGYSALAYLKYFPLDTLKLDRAFVEGIGHHPLDAAIAATIVRLARDLHLDCVAEGVEDAEQRDALQAIGATHLQGDFFSRPLEAAAFTQRLQDQQR